MSKSNPDLLKRLAWPSYFVAFLMVFTPVLDFATNVWPLAIGSVEWRYGSMGLLAGFLLTPLLGVSIALGAAAVLGHRLVVRIVSIVNTVLAPLLLVMLLFFALDVLQLRGAVPDDALSTFDTGAVKAAIKHATMAVALGWLGIVGIRAARSDGKQSRQRSSQSDVPLIRSEGVTPSSSSNVVSEK